MAEAIALARRMGDPVTRVHGRAAVARAPELQARAEALYRELGMTGELASRDPRPSSRPRR
jgi:hypothetical protein